MNKFVKKYLDVKKTEDSYPSVEDFIVWMLVDKSKTQTVVDEVLREERDTIVVFSKQFLQVRAAKGGRNSGNYTQMLKELNAETAVVDVVTPASVEILLTNKSKNKLGGAAVVKEKIETK